jgi:hypothetical protein
MAARVFLLISLGFFVLVKQISAQAADSVYVLTGIVYDESFRPLPASHVINMDSHEGDVTDSLGIFSLRVYATDTLLIRNIAYRDTLVSARYLTENPHVRLKRRVYQLQEARIFEWGSTYGDFRKAVIQMPKQQTLGESMGLPRQDPDYVPLEMDPEAIKSPALLIKSPLTYFYYNFSKEAKSARKVFWLKKNRQKIEQFERIIGGENLASITALEGEELMDFQAFLYEKMECDFNCTEFQIYAEIHAIWELYKRTKER